MGLRFEHNSFRFHIRAPLFVAREWMRHRVGSFNEFSLRYARATDDFYVPEADDVRSQVGKPGAYSFEPVSSEIAEETREKLQAVYETAYDTYQELVELGVARELARCALPVGAYTEFYWTVNARSLMNFLSLRNAETAQREIRRYAEACESFLERLMPVTYAAFVAGGGGSAAPGQVHLVERALRQRPEPAHDQLQRPVAALVELAHLDRRRGPLRKRRAVHREDRKSTRLNSSHVRSS